MVARLQHTKFIITLPFWLNKIKKKKLVYGIMIGIQMFVVIIYFVRYNINWYGKQVLMG